MQWLRKSSSGTIFIICPPPPVPVPSPASLTFTFKLPELILINFFSPPSFVWELNEKATSLVAGKQKTDGDEGSSPRLDRRRVPESPQSGAATETDGSPEATSWFLSPVCFSVKSTHCKSCFAWVALLFFCVFLVLATRDFVQQFVLFCMVPKWTTVRCSG